MAGGSHQRALTATPVSHRQTDQGRERHEGERKREIMRRGQTEVEDARGSKEIRGGGSVVKSIEGERFYRFIRTRTHSWK